jgi:hypothetical protein
MGGARGALPCFQAIVIAEGVVAPIAELHLHVGGGIGGIRQEGSHHSHLLSGYCPGVSGYQAQYLSHPVAVRAVLSAVELDHETEKAEDDKKNIERTCSHRQNQQLLR